MNKAKQILVLLLLTPLLVLAKSSVSYAYDLRGWLTNISTGTFTEELFYADGPGTTLYNGNISSIRWKDNTQSSKRGYKFSYDTANRLTSGAYGEGDALGSNTNRYSESMSYDANGNIKTLQRYGKTASGYGLMDNLNISYTGNQPTSVSESASDNNVSGAMEYKKANGSGYKFNANGSLVADKSRGIAYITYDFNNNPKQIYFTNGSVTKYVYSASGQKLRTVHYTAKPNISRTWGVKPAELTPSQILQADSTDYLLGGSLTLKNGKVDKYLFDGGYAQASATSTTSDNFTFYYYTPDHLGNIREVVDASGNVQQVTNYYPFGATYAESTAADFQPYKYNGKELDKMHGLNTYDYGARQHDPILARWDRMDPLCEKFYNVSPYVYCVDNPICAIDIKGLYPKGILNHHKTTFYRADYYTFTKPAAHLLSLVTGVKEDYIRDVNVIEKGIGREYPSYNPNNGGGGITIGSSPYNVTMTFTNNFFADNASDYNGNGYGQNITEWLSLVSHEATHIKHIEQAGNKISYLVHFLKQYVKYGDHDNVPEEKEADSKRNKYRKFSKFINDNYGENSIQNLFNSELSDGQKIRQIDDWWKEWQTYGK